MMSPASRPVEPHSIPSNGHAICEVRSILPSGTVIIATGGAEHEASVSTHIPGLLPGQPVLVFFPPGDTVPPLVTAAWSAPGAPQAQPWHFDAASGHLQVRAATLEFAADDAVLLRCGEAQIRLTRNGLLELRGDSITSAAVETHRIEGGSIELN